jgi:CRISPR type III-A-associated RAMP protein Csm5
MTNYIRTKVFKLKTLTPVHISDGFEGDIIPSEYVISESGQLHKISLSMLIDKLPADLLSALTDLMNKEDFVGIRSFIQATWKESPDIFEDCIEYSMNAGDVKSYYDNLQDENVENQLLVTPFIRSARKLFLPGSSVKGTIRTAIISELAKSIDIRSDGKSVKHDAQMLESDTLKYTEKDKYGKKKSNVIKDPLKSLKIGDSSTLTMEGIVKKVEVITKDKYGKFNADKMTDLKIFAEFIDSGVEIDIEARLDTRYFDIPNGLGRRLSFEDIGNSCRGFYKRLLIHERDKFFKDFDKQTNNSRVSALYDDFLRINEDTDSFLIRLGKHSGRNSLSLNLINKKGIEPRSMKFILKDGEYLPIGWIKVTVSE